MTRRPIPETDEFARVLRTALRLRGLPLSRVTARLAARGVPLSTATLSHWQRGQRRPEQAASLRAVEELEPILGLATGTLTGVLGPVPPRGAGLLPDVDPAVMRHLLGSRSPAEQALGKPVERLNEHLRPISIRDVVHLDREGRVHRLAVTHVMRALRGGVDRMTGVFQLDEGQDPFAGIVVRSGSLVSTRFEAVPNCLVVEFGLGRVLARGETSIVEYEMLVGGTDALPVSCHERVIKARLRDLVIQVRFHPGTVPAHCSVHYRRRLGEDPEKGRRIAVDQFHQTHVVLSDAEPGVHGISWTWPPGFPS
ncbi:hypothetical protein E2C11_16915 [Streptomyces lavendulae]|uniref:hypothetical protein n=1 Tax=Streptomyces sp. NPDC047813 TaxID=3154608 RepID=UPI0011CD8141|nr:hypothetical protein [Streptomyces lavendulae]TXJ77929.1 hypothetical protein E2C11_16915 [Streptomyces lavendulae]